MKHFPTHLEVTQARQAEFEARVIEIHGLDDNTFCKNQYRRSACLEEI